MNNRTFTSILPNCRFKLQQCFFSNRDPRRHIVIISFSISLDSGIVLNARTSKRNSKNPKSTRRLIENSPELVFNPAIGKVRKQNMFM